MLYNATFDETKQWPQPYACLKLSQVEQMRGEAGISRFSSDLK